MATMDAPSAERNKDPIWFILRDFIFRVLMDTVPTTNMIRILEVAAGSGVHTTYFCHHLDQLLVSTGCSLRFEWTPTDPDHQCRQSIDQRVRDISLLQGHIHNPTSLTLHEKGMLEYGNINGNKTKNDLSPMDCILCINMIHIAPWEATVGLMKISCDILTTHGFLCLYGPFLRFGTAVESNLAFDKALRERNSAYGVRNLEDVERVASDYDLFIKHIIDMPANNLIVIFCKTSNCKESIRFG